MRRQRECFSESKWEDGVRKRGKKAKRDLEKVATETSQESRVKKKELNAKRFLVETCIRPRPRKTGLKIDIILNFKGGKKRRREKTAPPKQGVGAQERDHITKRLKIGCLHGGRERKYGVNPAESVERNWWRFNRIRSRFGGQERCKHHPKKPKKPHKKEEKKKKKNPPKPQKRRSRERVKLDTTKGNEEKEERKWGGSG